MLGCGQAGLDENFFDLGGDSIQLAQVHARLQGILGREFPITDLFIHTTVCGLAAHFGGSKSASPANDAVAERARRQREAMAQRGRRGAFHEG